MVGLGGLCFHMSQFHAAQLFPENKGFISSLYVGFFIASGVTFELLRVVYSSLVSDEGAAHDTYRAILVGHAVLCLPWALLMLWMNPRNTLKPCQTYDFHTKRLQFCVSTKDLGAQMQGADRISSCLVVPATTSSGVESTAHSNGSVALVSPADKTIPGRVDSSCAVQTPPPPESEAELQLESEVDASGSQPAVLIVDACSSGCLDRIQDCSNLGHDRSAVNTANADRSFPLPTYSTGKGKKNCYQMSRRCLPDSGIFSACTPSYTVTTSVQSVYIPMVHI